MCIGEYMSALGIGVAVSVQLTGEGVLNIIGENALCPGGNLKEDRSPPVIR